MGDQEMRDESDTQISDDCSVSRTGAGEEVAGMSLHVAIINTGEYSIFISRLCSSYPNHIPNYEY